MEEYKVLIDNLYKLLLEFDIAPLRRQNEIIGEIEEIKASLPSYLRRFNLHAFLEDVLGVMRFDYELSQGKRNISELLQAVGIPYEVLKRFLFNYSPKIYDLGYTQVISKKVVEGNKKICQRVFNWVLNEIKGLNPEFGRITLEFYEIFTPNADAESNLNVVTVYLNLLAKAKKDYENLRFILPEDIITGVICHEVGHSMHQIVLKSLEKLFRTKAFIIADIFWEYIAERMKLYGLSKFNFKDTIKYYIISRLNDIWINIRSMALLLGDQEVINYIDREFGKVDKERLNRMTFSDKLKDITEIIMYVMKDLATLYAFLEKHDLGEIYNEMKMGTVFTLLKKRSIEDVLKESLKKTEN